MTRKNGYDFDPSNTDDNGDFIIGKGRPPESGKFKKGDGRKRGRRPKGTNNLATDLRKELDRKVAVTVGGVATTVSRQRAIVMRLADNATKGQNSAIALTLDMQQRLVDPILEQEQKSREKKVDYTRLSLSEKQIIEWLMCKLYNIKGASNMVGVMPIYHAGQYLNKTNFNSLKATLLTYGIEISRTSSFSPKNE